MKPLVAGTMIAALVACGHDTTAHSNEPPTDYLGVPELTVTSSAFAADAAIPSEYTCQGENTTPPLAWSGAPAAAKSFAVIVDDPDAPTKTWVHWVVADIPGTATTLDAVTIGKSVVGTNDFKKQAWGGPCPPSGRHRYMFKVYALDVAAVGKAGMSKSDLLVAMKGHVIARGELVGTYKKSK